MGDNLAEKLVDIARAAGPGARPYSTPALTTADRLSPFGSYRNPTWSVRIGLVPQSDRMPFFGSPCSRCQRGRHAQPDAGAAADPDDPAHSLLSCSSAIPPSSYVGRETRAAVAETAEDRSCVLRRGAQSESRLSSKTAPDARSRAARALSSPPRNNNTVNPAGSRPPVDSGKNVWAARLSVSECERVPSGARAWIRGVESLEPNQGHSDPEHLRNALWRTS